MIEQLVREGLAEIDGVKRWIDNDIDAGDEAITIHAEALARAREKFEAAAAEAARLHGLTGPDHHVVDHNEDSHGYEISPAERAELDGKGPR
jgi:hypothetical protein